MLILIHRSIARMQTRGPAALILRPYSPTPWKVYYNGRKVFEHTDERAARYVFNTTIPERAEKYPDHDFESIIEASLYAGLNF